MIKDDLIYFSVLGTRSIICGICSTPRFIYLISFSIIYIDMKLSDFNIFPRYVKYDALIGQFVNNPAACCNDFVAICTVDINRNPIRELCRVDRFIVSRENRCHN